MMISRKSCFSHAAHTVQTAIKAKASCARCSAFSRTGEPGIRNFKAFPSCKSASKLAKAKLKWLEQLRFIQRNILRPSWLLLHHIRQSDLEAATSILVGGCWGSDGLFGTQWHDWEKSGLQTERGSKTTKHFKGPPLSTMEWAQRFICQKNVTKAISPRSATKRKQTNKQTQHNTTQDKTTQQNKQTCSYWYCQYNRTILCSNAHTHTAHCNIIPLAAHLWFHPFGNQNPGKTNNSDSFRQKAHKKQCFSKCSLL